MTKKKILFISSANLTTNPRLQKELKIAVEQGHEVDFVGFYSRNWSDKVDSTIIKDINANFHYISATRKPFLKWFFSTAFETISRKIYKLRKEQLKINAYAHSKRTILIQQFLKKNKKKYDIIIAHTLATLYPAYILAKKQNIPFTFDIEDYHPGEIIYRDGKNEIERRKFLMQELLPKASYITYASPLIGEYSLKLLNSQLPTLNSQLINNCFSETEFQFKENNSKKIKFVWFSQNISKGRGLELILPALAKFKAHVEVNLIGNLYQGFYDTFLYEFSDFVKIIPPLPQKELNLKLSEFDIGLAIEISSVDLNKDIALSNKIFAYAQAGLYIFATNTKAQKQFLQEHSQLGISVKQEVLNISNEIEIIIKNILKIRQQKKERYNYSQKLSWEKESEKLVKIWNEILSYD